MNPNLTTPVTAPPVVTPPTLAINRITFNQPWEWLDKGWRDLKQAHRYSLIYGGAIVCLSILITLGLILEGLFFIVPFLAAGFYLMAPIIGLGLYQMSAHLERGEPLQHCHALEAWRRNHSQLAMLTAALIIIMQCWMMANFVLFALLYTNLHPPLEQFFNTVFLSGDNYPFVFASLLVGFVLAWVAYAISAISVPLLMDHPIDGLTAMRLSVQAVWHNLGPMTLWAGLIVLLVGIGLLTFYIGLVVALPLIGHATWHAYRDLIKQV